MESPFHLSPNGNVRLKRDAVCTSAMVMTRKPLRDDSSYHCILTSGCMRSSPGPHGACNLASAFNAFGNKTCEELNMVWWGERQDQERL